MYTNVFVFHVITSKTSVHSSKCLVHIAKYDIHTTHLKTDMQSCISAVGIGQARLKNTVGGSKAGSFLNQLPWKFVNI